MGAGDVVSQEQLDTLIQLSEFIGTKKGATRQLIREMRSAILDSGRLSLEEWRSLRAGLKEIEELLPVMDIIIRLKDEEARSD